MDEFNPIKEICMKIQAASAAISDYEESIVRLQNHGEHSAAETFLESQGFALEQLQSLTLLLTGMLVPEQEEEFEEELDNADEAEGGSVFMAGELDDKLPPIESEYPVEEQEETENE